MTDDLVERFTRWTDDHELGERLLRRYAEPHRRYHTVEHLTEVLRAIDRNSGEDSFEIELAAWYHDAIYDPAAPQGQNEAASADLAARELRALGVEAPRVDEVRRLVMLTAGHEVAPDDRNGIALADADLGILGAESPRYRRYVADVRAEYAHVADDAWRIGRASVLRTFLDRPRIYLGAAAHQRLDERARTNLGEELLALG